MTPEQLQRYSRQMILSQVGKQGQERLLAARVLVVGLGGLGCPSALYLAAAGVGQLGLLDFDVVDASNLQRQVLYTTQDVGQPKASIAARRLKSLNPDVSITEYNQRLTADNAIQIISDYDVILDGTDNFPTRYLVNDACVLAKKTNVYGSILRFDGQVSVLGHEDGPCYRCLFPIPPHPGDIPKCAEAGVLGVLPGLIGTTQATEAIKLILGIGEPLIGRLLLLDALGLNWRSMQVQRHPNCPICSKHATINQLEEIDFSCESDSESDQEILSLTPAEIGQRIGQSPDDFVLLDVREVFETEISPIPSAVNIPLGQLEDQVKDVQAWHDKTIIVFCQKGMRSLKAIQLLQTKGINNLLNMHGGIDRWLSDGNASL